MASAFSFNTHNISLEQVMILHFTDEKSDTEWLKKKKKNLFKLIIGIYSNSFLI